MMIDRSDISTPAPARRVCPAGNTHARPAPWFAQRALPGILVALAALVACGPGATGAASRVAVAPPRVANLHAFARLYGVVRWFHPSDAASAIDWDRFAIDGAHRVIDAPDARALEARLTALLAPLAPTAQIIGPGEAFADPPALHPAATADLDVVAWQHKGFGDSGIATGYVSKRRHRDVTVTQHGVLFAALFQSIDATALRGARVRLRGNLRTAHRGRGQLWLRVDHGAVSGFFDNMTGRPVLGDTWTPAEITSRRSSGSAPAHRTAMSAWPVPARPSTAIHRSPSTSSSRRSS